MKRLATLVVLGSLLLGAGNRKLKRLEPQELTHFQALEVWMDDKESKAYLKLKTRAERDAWLKERGLWERFYQYDPQERDAIAAGEVEVGWSQDKVYMAWGRPHQRRKLGLTTASRSELFVYRFEVTDEGKILVWEPKSKTAHSAAKRFRLELTVIEGKVDSIDKVDSWDF